MSEEMDPPSALGLSIVYLIVAAFGLPLNLFIVFSTLMRKSLRTIPLNWFLLNAAMADFAYLLSLSLFLFWSLYGDQLVCKMAGFGMYYFSMISIVTAPFLAGLRYTSLSGNSRFANVFSRRGIICIDIGIWIVAALIYLPYVVLNKLGLEKVGMCGITHDGRWYETPYFLSCTGVLFIAYGVTFFFNRRLHSWVKNMSSRLISLTGESQETLAETRNLLKIFRWFLIAPLIANGPTAILQLLSRMDVQALNIRWDRVIVALGVLPPLVNPFVTIKYLRPYRTALKEVGSKIPTLSTILQFLFKEDSETNWNAIKTNVTNKVHAVYRISLPLLAKRTNSVSVHNVSTTSTLPSIVL